MFHWDKQVKWHYGIFTNFLIKTTTKTLKCSIQSCWLCKCTKIDILAHLLGTQYTLHQINLMIKTHKFSTIWIQQWIENLFTVTVCEQ